MQLGPDRYGIFEANADTDIREQENPDYDKSAECGYQTLVIKIMEVIKAEYLHFNKLLPNIGYSLVITKRTTAGQATSILDQLPNHFFLH